LSILQSEFYELLNQEYQFDQILISLVDF